MKKVKIKMKMKTIKMKTKNKKNSDTIYLINIIAFENILLFISFLF